MTMSGPPSYGVASPRCVIALCRSSLLSTALPLAPAQSWLPSPTFISGRLKRVLRHMVFTGLPLSVEDAYRFGFVQEIVEQEQLQARAMELARLISSKAPLGLRLGKESMNAAEFLPVEEGYAGEQVFSTRLMRTEDAREATRAVVEKRAPVWSGR
jgi:enoyl-CoA hydratase/carnithine racemase